MLNVASMVPMRTSRAHADVIVRPPPAAPMPPRNDAHVEMLKAMFPDVEADVLMQMLSYHNGDVERVINTMLDTTADVTQEEDADAEIARQIQASQDEEMAKAIAASFDAEDDRRRRNDPTVRAANATASAASATVKVVTDASKAFLAKVTPAGRRAAGLSTTTSTSHGVRLLDSPLVAGNLPYDMSPLSVPTYAPPATPVYVAPPPTDPIPDVSDEPGPPAPTEPNNRYSSRMDRARAANRQRLSSSPPAPPAQASVVVPVGELI